MSENKTQKTDVTPRDFLAGIEPEKRREQSLVLLEFFERVTGWKPRMWGPSIIGFGEYHYKYDSGREGDFMATGFSPRKTSLTVYILPGYQDYGPILARLGKHKLGKSCLYINKLEDIDMDVLEELVKAGIADLSKKYPVKAS
ncbi:DUF1801 domain-containing protein [Hyphobacterium sp. HN65]|uniref:DUF1801 domain-containing protein n=1 Tax=Hyphobacterium lacteum TaxID=3116575 RepID=A0ABU7LMY8_9PROT|nr:DUF1801 domain-containing protein [Hyphobacterium sp. HN65]MEE2525296.1 DUF1801 domain-containing protein [Hyphobacterium sp. HN65]